MKNLCLGMVIIFLSIFTLGNAFGQSSIDANKKDDEIVKTEDVTSTTTQSIKVKKKPFKLPVYMAPANTTIDANCVDQLGKGNSGYTSCQAGKGTR
jgi:hypothetical protein